MKKIISIISGLVMTFAFAGTALAYNSTVGNEPILRSNTDSRADFVVVDTNNPADHEGLLERFEYFATTNNPFYFIVVDDGDVVQWVSEKVNPSIVGLNEFVPTTKAPVETGWNVGLYCPETGTVPYDYSGDDRAFFTNAGWGIPVVGETLTFQNLIQNRTYSYVGYYDPDLDDDGVLNEDDLCPDTVIDQPYGGIGVNRWYWNGDAWETELPKGQQYGELNRNKQYDMTDTSGCSCEQILAMITELNESDMEGHYKFGCSKSILDDFILDGEDGTIDGLKFWETVTIPANTIIPTLSTVIPVIDKNYLLKAYGTADAGDTIEFDAQYSVTTKISGDTWTDLVSGYTTYGTSLLDLFVDGLDVDWGSLDEVNHIYNYEYLGTGNRIEFYINDIYPINNKGNLYVDISQKLY